MSSLLSTLARAGRALWWFLDASRRALLNLLFVALLAALAWGLLRGGAPALQPKTALVLDLQGRISEQRPASSRSAVLRHLQGEGDGGARLRDLLAVLDAAAKDPAITHALLMTDDLGAAGLPTLREVAAALQRLQAAGKPVIAWGAQLDQRGYYLAAHASEVWLHPMGSVSVQGYGRLRSYYKDLFDKVGITAHVVRAGQYKNAGETFTASGPSPQTLESDAALYGALWASWTTGVERARKKPAGSVMQAIDSLPASLEQAGGDPAGWALQRQWVDALKTRDEMRAAMVQRGAVADDAKPDDGRSTTFRQVHWRDYLARIKPRTDGDALGVIVAEGGIGDGRDGPGRIGGLSTAELIRQARDDKHIKALVLRVNSPGGSAFGSELVRRELELTRAAGKPVVVSMGDVAASGGYWISLAADEIVADEATITGSIGVVAMLPSAGAALGKLGINAAGSSTTWLGTAYDPRRGLDPRFERLLQASVDHVYRDFTARAAAARKTTPEKIDAVAQGRVWAGKDALGHGLVDRLGGLENALKSAATRAKLGADARVVYVEAAPGRLDRWLQRFGLAELTAWAGAAGALFAGDPASTALTTAAAALGLPPAAAAPLLDDLAWLAEPMPDGRHFTAATHCLCVAP
ncbi:MAG: signal peptide peptidase SppA [Leptothrix sp. (in: Bacteria)]|nr:signal peptide peptidase SppA [Leptothrix sp. (in: b-proteobacteria)]